MAARGLWRVSGAVCLALVLGCGQDGASGPAAPDSATPRGDASPADAESPADAGPDAALPPDAATDAAPTDAALAGDASPDAAPPPAAPTFCAACTENADCLEPGAICLTNQATGEQFCGRDCAPEGVVCPRGSQCYDVGNGNLQCAPTTATCATWPPSDLGLACTRDNQCASGADRCDRGLCALGCETARDCGASGYACDEGVCRPAWSLGPEGCGLGLRCGADAACPDGRLCVDATAGGAPMPTRVPAFCAAPCEDDAACDADEVCAEVNTRRVCLPARCACLADVTTPSLVDEALGVAGVHACDAGFDSTRLALFPPTLSADAFRLSFFDTVHRDAPSAVEFGAATSRAFGADLRAASGVARAIARQADALDAPTMGEPTPAAAPEGGLAAAVERLYALAGRAEQFNADALTEGFAPVPAPLQAAVARVVWAQANVLDARKRMFNDAGVGPAQVNAWFDALPGAMVRGPAGLNYADPAQVALLSRSLDLSLLFTAARDLAATVSDVDWQPFEGVEGFSVDVNTPFGRLVVRDAAATTLSGAGPYLLVVDTGGDDTYTAPVAATKNATAGVSVVVELGGDDTYGYAQMDDAPQVAGVPPADEGGRAAGNRPYSRSTTWRQGGAVLGAALLYDRAGNDRYTSLRVSQGAGVAGVGVLHDAAGDDTYACEAGCQGAGAYGIGLLVDDAGADRYSVVQSGQAFGGVRGAGVLVDRAGADHYTALLGDPQFGGTILFDSAQNPAGSNASFAQGAAFGRRADADGTWASGGLAVLRDEAGDDTYTVDIFGQGTGYWFGVGILTDVEGDDVYNGRYYIQGSSAHFAMSLFYDGAGNDLYNQGLPRVDDPAVTAGVILGTSVGQGHDFSVGVLADYSGDDAYIAPSLGLGGGNDNGIGLFLEAGGADRYDVPDGTTYGGSNSGERGAEFEAAICMGLFADADGADTYATFAPEGAVGNDRAWAWGTRRAQRRPGMQGGGLDRVGGPRRPLPALTEAP